MESFTFAPRVCFNARCRLYFYRLAWFGCSYETDVGKIFGISGNGESVNLNEVCSHWFVVIAAGLVIGPGH